MGPLDDPDTAARLIYLILLLVVLASVLFGGGWGRLGTALRQALVWVLIFAMVVIAYGYRDVLRATLLPGTAILVSEDVIELRRAADGHFFANVEVNGAPVRFMVDTGASDVVLSAADARRAGIELEALAFSGRAMTANGPVQTASVRLGEVRFGGSVERDLRASVTSGALGTSLLGMSYLDRFSRIEIAGERMILTR